MADSHRLTAAWMELPIDDRILETLNLGLTLSSTIIAENIEATKADTTRRLGVLIDYGLVETVETDRYEITTSGREYVAMELDASNLSSDG